MTRRPLRLRILALLVEVLGAALVCAGVALWNVIGALIVGGLLLIVAAQFPEQLL
jgi:hypothetical protein